MRSLVTPKAVLATLTVVIVSACGGGSNGPVATAPAGPAAETASARASAPPATASASASARTIVVPATDPEPALAEAWRATGPAADPACTYAPSVDGKGNIWLAVCWGSDFWIVDADGKHVEAWGTKGAGAGQFDFAYPAAHDSIGAIAFAPDGTFFTIDAGNLRVQHFGADRKLIGSWGSFGKGDGQLAKPTSIAVGADGLVYVADGVRADVQAFQPDGTFLRSMAKGQAGGGEGFAYLAVDRSGKVYVNRRHDVLQYSPQGELLLVIDVGKLCPSTSGMAFDAAGNMFLACRSDRQPDATLELGPDFGLLHHWPGTGETLAVDPNGTALYVSDVESAFLVKLNLPAS